MHEEFRALLNTYLDGELHGKALKEMKSHLSTCPECRNELNELRQLSEQLHALPTPQVIPVERFISNLSLLQQRRLPQERPLRMGSLAWWLVPVGLLGAWVFLRTAFAISDVLSAVNLSGLLGYVGTWLHGADQQSLWYLVLNSLTAGGSAGLQQATAALNDLNLIGADLVSGFLWQALIVLLYWGWLIAWMLKKRDTPVYSSAGVARS